MSNETTLEQSPLQPQEATHHIITTRDRIIAAATRLFIEKGYHGTSTQDIAEAVSIRKSSLFHHFKNKFEIASATISSLTKQCIHRVFTHAGDQGIEQKEHANHTLESICHFLAESDAAPLVGFIGTELSPQQPEIRLPIANYVNAWLDGLTKVLEPLHADKAKSLAKDSLNVIHGAMVMQRVSKDNDYLERLKASLTELWRV